MDFLEIRKKAKELAAARALAQAGASPAGPPPTPPEPPATARIAAALPALAPAEAGSPRAAGGHEPTAPEAPPQDGRFTTWRPGSGAPPLPLDLTALGVAADAGATAPEEPAARPRPLPAPGAPHAPVPHAPGDACAAAARSGPARSPLDEFFYREDEDAPGLPQLGFRTGPEPGAAAEAEPIDEFLTFRLGAEEYGVAIRQVREVMKAPIITEVPRAPAHILGVVTVRGEVVPVFDPRRRLDLPDAGRVREGADRVIIVDAGEGTSGLLVDAVSSVVRLRRGAVEPCPQGIGGAASDCLAGIGRERDRLFTVLDLAALLRRAPPGRRAGER